MMSFLTTKARFKTGVFVSKEDAKWLKAKVMEGHT